MALCSISEPGKNKERPRDLHATQQKDTRHSDLAACRHIKTPYLWVRISLWQGRMVFGGESRKEGRI